MPAHDPHHENEPKQRADYHYIKPTLFYVLLLVPLFWLVHLCLRV